MPTRSTRAVSDSAAYFTNHDANGIEIEVLAC